MKLKESNTRTAFIVILKLLFITNTFCQSALIDKSDVMKFSVNGINIKELSSPGNDFELLKPLGQPKDTVYNKEFAYEKWIIVYEGIELTYFNTNGYPELFEMKVTDLDTDVKLNFNSIRIDNTTEAKVLLNNEVKSRKIDKIDEYDKYEGNFSYMEFFINEKKNNINKIIYRCKVD